MAVIAITILLWFCSILTRAIEDQKKQKNAINRIDREVKNNSTIVRQLEREQRVLAEEQRKQAAQLAKHEERLLRLEQKLELAQRDEAHYADEVTAITIDMSGVKAYVDYMNGRGLPCKGKEAELEKLNKKLYTAETKLIKARQAREFCEKQMEVA